MSWIEDEVDDADDSPTGEPETSDAAGDESFAKQLQAIVAAGNSTIATELLEDGLGEVEDVELLERTLDHVDAEEKRELVEERLDELGADTTDTDDEAEQEASDADETDESDEADDPEVSMEDEEYEDFEAFDTAIRQSILDGVLETVPLSEIEEYAEELDDDVVERAVEEAERDEALEVFEEIHADRQTDDDPTEEKPLDDEEDAADSVFGDSGSDDADDDESEVFGDTSDDTDDTEEDDSDPESTVTPDEIPDGEPDWKDSFDSAASQSGGVSVNEAAQMEKRWSMLVWSDPGKGKTHFGYTTKEPVCIIDTEGKGHHLSDKFTNKTVRLFQPSDYDEALDALHDALDLLHDVYENHGRVGTIVVDSMSIMWEWAQQKYVDKFYRGKDVDEVEFSSAIGSGGQSDWKQIKRYHNVKFRQAILDSPFHFVWTAMSADDYEAAIENDINFTPKKPSGEKNNEYKASEVLRLRENDEGDTVGELEKSDKIKHHYTDLKDPDFPKHKEVVEAIKNAEAGERSIQSVESEFDVTVFEGNPRTARIAEEK